MPVPWANPQTLTVYAMVADDPESFADLDGHCDETRQLPKSKNCPILRNFA